MRKDRPCEVKFRVLGTLDEGEPGGSAEFLGVLRTREGYRDNQNFVAVAEMVRARSDGHGPVISVCPYEGDDCEVVMGDESGIFVLSFSLEGAHFARLTEILDEHGNSL